MCAGHMIFFIRQCPMPDGYFKPCSKDYCKKAPVDLVKYIQIRCNSLFPIGSFLCTTHVKQELRKKKASNDKLTQKRKSKETTKLLAKKDNSTVLEKHMKNTSDQMKLYLGIRSTVHKQK